MTIPKAPRSDRPTNGQQPANEVADGYSPHSSHFVRQNGNDQKRQKANVSALISVSKQNISYNNLHGSFVEDGSARQHSVEDDEGDTA